jgi:hypothetical protein
LKEHFKEKVPLRLRAVLVTVPVITFSVPSNCKFETQSKVTSDELLDLIVPRAPANCIRSLGGRSILVSTGSAETLLDFTVQGVDPMLTRLDIAGPKSTSGTRSE